jgi:hypothetical protein
MQSLLQLLTLAGVLLTGEAVQAPQDFVEEFEEVSEACILPSSAAADPYLWMDGCNRLMATMTELEERRKDLQEAALAASASGDSLGFLRALNELQAVLAAQDALLAYQNLCNAIRAKLASPGM